MIKKKNNTDKSVEQFLLIQWTFKGCCNKKTLVSKVSHQTDLPTKVLENKILIVLHITFLIK